MITKEQFCFGMLWLGDIVATQNDTGTTLLIGVLVGLVVLGFFVYYSFNSEKTE